MTIEISVCICTYGRTHVSETVQSVLSQKVSSQLNLEIVVVDDHPQRFAEALISRTGARYVWVGTENIASARNACLAHAKGRYIAFIDDDEVADPIWIEELSRAQKKWSAHVIKGDVSARYPVGTSSWVHSGDPFSRRFGEEGAVLQTCGAGNVLFDREFMLANGITFNPHFGKTGGEDTDFFSRAANAGARIIACPTAIVTEIVPHERVTLASIARRYRQQGAKDCDSPTVAARLRHLGAALFCILATVMIFPFHKRASFRMFTRALYRYGIVTGAGAKTKVYR